MLVRNEFASQGNLMETAHRPNSDEKVAAIRLAVAFLRKSAGRNRFLSTVQRSMESEGSWIFDFYHPRWRDYRRRGLPYGYRIEVHKASGKAEHFGTLQRKGATAGARA